RGGGGGEGRLTGKAHGQAQQRQFHHQFRFGASAVSTVIRARPKFSGGYCCTICRQFFQRRIMPEYVACG
ncbi:hypothetical protein, partial [Pseudomonas sp.]|uniref:hypothetical protein n=2 Tax=unclassified Pseudomonas TaxID=196821 RepID=UPI00264885D6